VLQHGSVLLARSVAAPELPGIVELTGLRVTCDALIDAWRPALEQHLGLAFSDHAVSPERRRLAEQFAERKYASDDWIRDRRWASR
jgi:lipoate-protein ligase A